MECNYLQNQLTSVLLLAASESHLLLGLVFVLGMKPTVKEVLEEEEVMPLARCSHGSDWLGRLPAPPTNLWQEGLQVDKWSRTPEVSLPKVPAFPQSFTISQDLNSQRQSGPIASYLRVSGTKIIHVSDGEEVTLRDAGIGGWMK